MKKEIVNKDLIRLVYNYLRDLGVPYNLRGHQYLIEAIIMVIKDSSLPQLTKFIYPSIASKFNTNSASVEKCIRTAIKAGFANSDPETIKQIFGNTIANKKIPTNSVFIYTISQNLKLNLL